MKLNAKELRDLEERRVNGEVHKVKRNPIYFILENIYDTYNIGGLFRLADALAIEKMYLCGDTEIPPNSRIKKASIGTYKVVDWEYCKTVKEAIDDLRLKIKDQRSSLHFSNFERQVKLNKNNLAIQQCNNITIIAVEQYKTALDYRKADYSFPIALVFGNETYGVLPETLKLVDQIVEIPMWGINKSLNVIVSAAIVSYWVISKIKTHIQ